MPMRILSIAASKSSMVALLLPALNAIFIAMFIKFFISAPVNPVVYFERIAEFIFFLS
jgi:hypothetical protein